MQFLDNLRKNKNIRVIPSQANYFLCEILNGYTATDFTKTLLDKYNILIKDLSHKKGFSGEYVRIAVKKPEENGKIVDAINSVLI